MTEEKPWEKMPRIDWGLALDHVSTERGPFVYIVVFDWLKQGTTADIRTNIPSVKLKAEGEKDGRKWVFKLEKLKPEQDLLDRLALAGGHLTVNVIENYKVVNKIYPKLPQTVTDGLIYCRNPNCTTVLDHHAAENPKFLLSQIKPVLYECDYCGRQVDQKAIDELILTRYKI